MAPTKKSRSSKTPYEKPTSESNTQKKTTKSKKAVGGGDIESSTEDKQVSYQDYSDLLQHVHSLEDSLAAIANSLKLLQPKDADPSISESMNQPRMGDLCTNVQNNTNIATTQPLQQEVDLNTEIPSTNVEESIQQHLQIMMGGPSYPEDNGKTFKSIALPFDLHVSDKVKQKIWDGNFIDLTTIN
jgi:hypothetical protein